MSRQGRQALAVLTGMAFGAGVLLYLAVAADVLPGAGVLIALGASIIAGGVPLVLELTQSDSPGPERCRK